MTFRLPSVCLATLIFAWSPPKTAADAWEDDWGDEDAEEQGSKKAPGVAIHGSYENQLTSMTLRRQGGGTKNAIFDSNRLRVDLEADLSGGIEVRAAAVAQLFAGQTEIPLRDLIPAATLHALVSGDARWAMVLADVYGYENLYRIQDAYAKIPIKNAVVTVGKQPLGQGAGYVWNPTDPFTSKDIFDPTYEKPGVIALRLILPLSSRVFIDAVAAPGGDLAEWTAGGRLNITAGPVTMGGVFYATEDTTTDLEGSLDAIAGALAAGGSPEDGIRKVEAERLMAGGELIADILGARLWVEGAYNFVEDLAGARDDYAEIVAGLEYFFPFETHLMIEALYYGAGAEQRGGFYTFGQWSKVLEGETKMLGRYFLFESLDHPVGDFWTLGLSSFQSVSDGSVAVMADATYAFAQDAELWLLATVGLGDPADLFGSSYGQGWARLKLYF